MSAQEAFPAALPEMPRDLLEFTGEVLHSSRGNQHGYIHLGIDLARELFKHTEAYDSGEAHVRVRVIDTKLHIEERNPYTQTTHVSSVEDYFDRLCRSAEFRQAEIQRRRYGRTTMPVIRVYPPAYTEEAAEVFNGVYSDILVYKHREVLQRIFPDIVPVTE